jgi:tRNA pseudouridine38-40 synthase
MRRFFIELSYNGTRFCGWQRQPNAPSVQQTIEEKMQLLLRKPIEIVGCGRTDSGVHAHQYFAHFDLEDPLFDPQYFLFRLNKIVGADIRLHQIIAVEPEQHARFAATSRSYEYHISFKKNIFETETTWFVAHRDRLNTDLMQQAAQILLEFKEFSPFCKTNSDAQTMFCELTESRWEFFERHGSAHRGRVHERRRRATFASTTPICSRNTIAASKKLQRSAKWFVFDRYKISIYRKK